MFGIIAGIGILCIGTVSVLKLVQTHEMNIVAIQNGYIQKKESNGIIIWVKPENVGTNSIVVK